MSYWNMRNGETDRQVRFDHASKKLAKYLGIVDRGKCSQEIIRKCAKWASRLAYEVFKMHPELRDEGSFSRYFVAKEGRKAGIRGAALTEYVEGKYADGTWWKLVPEEVLRGESKHDVA